MPQLTGAIPILSLRHQTESGTRALHLELFIQELERQAILASRYLESSWRRGMNQETPIADSLVWGDLQAGLFASIVVQRILKPTTARGHGELSRKSATRLACQRGEALRTLLQIDEHSAIFQVTIIRDALEHVDERFDQVVHEGIVSVSDWSISSGISLRTPPETLVDRAHCGRRLRQFFPAAGLVYFDDQTLDLFTLDLALRELVHLKVPQARAKLIEAHSEGVFQAGSMQTVVLMEPDMAQLRYAQWLAARQSLGQPVADPPDFAMTH